MTRRAPRLAVALLERFVPDNEPLTGDLLEGWYERSEPWFWRQVLFAILGRAILQVRTSPRTATEAALVGTAMLALLGFHAVVAASLMNQLLILIDLKWMSGNGHHQDWLWFVTASSFPVAVLIGRVIRGFHRDHRVAATIACGASATIAAFVNLNLFVLPIPPRQSFFPGATLQIAAAMVFIAGLFAGIGSRSRCEPLPSS